MQRAKTIDELYEEVRDYDIVLCNDAPLATALNNRVDVPKLGIFAITPRQLALQLAVDLSGSSVIGDISLVKKVSNDTGYSLRYVHGEIQNIQRMLRFITDVKPYLGKKSRNVYNSYVYYNTLDMLMTKVDMRELDYFDLKKVAVIGLDLFDNLDKFMLPPDFDDIDMFRYGRDAEEYEIPEIRLLGNNRQIAECAYDIVRRTDPKDVAIVMDSAGSIADALRSVMYRNRIPFINTLNVRDLNSIRDYLEFCSLSLRFDTLKVRDARQLLGTYHGRIAHRFESYSLSVLYRNGFFEEGSTVRKLVDCMSDVRNMTFQQLCDTCVPNGKDRGNIGLLLRDMDCVDEKVSPDVLDDLLYAVNSIGSLNHNEQIPAEEKEGVVLIDCKNSVYVDRPVVIYAGLGSDWNTDMKNLDFLDQGRREVLDDNNRIRFNVLMQQGTARFYLANSTKGGKDAQPCSFFEGIDGQKVETFDNVSRRVIRNAWKVDQVDRSTEIRMELLDSDDCDLKHFSPSRYSDFVSCPRMYMLSSLVSDADSDITYTGSRIHDYAEFRVSYPEKAKELGVERCAELIAEKCAALQAEELEEVERTQIRTSVVCIDRFVESKGVLPSDMKDRSDEKAEPNMFFEMFGLDKASVTTEVELMSSETYMRGIMDFSYDGVIYDYKTGKTKSLKEIMDAMDFGFTKKLKNFQPMFYLCLMKDSGSGARTFKLFFPRDMLSKQIKQGSLYSIAPCFRTIETAETRKDAVLTFAASDFEKTYGGIPLEPVIERCLQVEPDPVKWYNNKAVEDAAKEILVGKKSKAKGLVNKLSHYYEGDIVKTDDMLVITEDVLTGFRERVKSDMEKNRIYYSSEYPAMPMVDCDSCYYKDMCTVQSLKGGETDDIE